MRGKTAPAGTSFKFPSPASAGMAIVQTVSKRFEQDHLLDISALAEDIRNHTEDCLEPQNLLDIVSLYDQRQLEMKKEGVYAFMLPEYGDGMLGVNLMHR